MKPLSREQRIYLAIWRKAFKTPDETVRFQIGDKSTALSTRMAMYRAIRPFRENISSDHELFKAGEIFVLKLCEFNPGVWGIELAHRKTLTAAELAFENLGLDEADLNLFEESAALEDLKSLLPEAERSTPFFTRG